MCIILVWVFKILSFPVFLSTAWQGRNMEGEEKGVRGHKQQGMYGSIPQMRKRKKRESGC